MTPTPLDALTRLQAALDTLAVALARGDSEAVLAAEEPLASAVTGLADCPRPDGDVPGLAQAISRVRTSVGRCEALGESAADFIRAVLPPPAYARATRRVAADRLSRRHSQDR